MEMPFWGLQWFGTGRMADGSKFGIFSKMLCGMTRRSSSNLKRLYWLVSEAAGTFLWINLDMEFKKSMKPPVLYLTESRCFLVFGCFNLFKPWLTCWRDYRENAANLDKYHVPNLRQINQVTCERFQDFVVRGLFLFPAFRLQAKHRRSGCV